MIIEDQPYDPAAGPTVGTEMVATDGEVLFVRRLAVFAEEDG